MLVCDKCKAEFSLKPVDIKTIRIKADGEDFIVRYFVCPKCLEVYIFFILRFGDLGIMLTGQNLNSQFQIAVKTGQVALAKRLYQRHDSIKKLLDDKVKKLMSKYSKSFGYNKATDEIYYRGKNTEKENENEKS